MRPLLPFNRLLKLTLAAVAVASLIALPALSPARRNPSARLPAAVPTSLANAGEPARLPVDQQTQARVNDAYGQLPLSFEANAGQTDAQVKFISRGAGYKLFLTADEAVLALTRHQEPEAGDAEVKPISPNRVANPPAPVIDELRMKLVGTNRTARASGAGELEGKVNYFIGNDPAKWRTNISTFRQVHYAQVYEGIDLVYYGNQGQLEYDFKVAPGADPGRIRLAFKGAKQIRIEKSGDLVLRTEGGEVRQHRPVIYQEAAGGRQIVAGRYVMLSEREVAFELGRYDHSRELTIDPTISYGTYFYLHSGNNDYEIINGITVDSAGCAYIAGYEYVENDPSEGAFVSKLNATGTGVLFTTYLGGTVTLTNGSSFDTARGVAVDSDGYVYVGGYTNAADFPTTDGVYQPAIGGGCDVLDCHTDAFVTKLNPTGSALIYSTYIGGNDNESFANLFNGHMLALDSERNVIIAGGTFSTNFPTKNAYQSTLAGGSIDGDGFITKLNATGSDLVYSTFLGGSAGSGGATWDWAVGVAVDATGNACVTGTTLASDIPTTPGAYRQAPYPCSDGVNGCPRVYIAKFNPAGGIIYCTYFGGSGWGWETVGGIAADAAGNAYITGQTNSENFPVTAGAFQTAPPLCANSPTSIGPTCWWRGYVAKLNPSGTARVYTTFLGSTDPSEHTFDKGQSIAVDSAGNAYVLGATYSRNFPITPGAPQATKTGNEGMGIYFVTKLNQAGSALRYSTYFGGDSYQGAGLEGGGIALDSEGNAYVTGYAFAGFPTTPGAFHSSPANGIIAPIIAKLDSCSYVLTPASVTLPGSAGASSFNVEVIAESPTAVCNWAPSTAAPWINITAGGGSANGTVNFSVTENTSNEPRTADIIVKGRKFTVVQQSCVSINPTFETFEAAAGQGTITITAPGGCDWMATEALDWVTITAGASGSGNGTVSYSVAANPETESRQGSITIAGNLFTITQQGCPATISPTHLDIPNAGGQGEINVTAQGCHWRVASNNSWLHIDSGAEGSGSGTVQFSADANTGQPRTGTITVAGKNFTVTQQPCDVEINPVKQNFPPTGGNGSFAVTAMNCGWQATTAANWINITSGNGNGNGTVSFTVAQGNANQPRSAVITVGNRSFTVTQGAQPVVTTLARQYPGVFLKGTSLTNQFTATIDWKGGQPGTVKFEVVGKETTTETAMGNFASHSFNLASDFTPMFLPSRVIITPTSGEGIEGQARTENLYVFDFPKWLQDGINGGFGSLGFTAGGGEIKYCVEREFPKPHLAANGPIDIPEFVPYIGGKFGLTETFARIKGCVSSNGTGTLTLFGQTGFKAAGGELNGNATGSGVFALGPPGGFNLRSASFALNLNGSISKDVGIADAIPQLVALQNAPVIGKPIKWLNEKGKLEGEISPALGFTAAFQQNLGTGNLDFKDGTGTLGIDLKATLKVKANDHLKASAWVGGGGSFTLGVPETDENPFVRQLEVKFQAGAEFKLDYLISYKGKAVYNAKCIWTPLTDTVCESSGSVSGGSSLTQFAVSLVKPDYERFGKVAAFKPAPIAHPVSSRIPLTIAETTIISNLFPGASPTLVEAGNGKLLLWAHQDTALPVLQSTDIQWSYNNGSTWSTPAPIAHDARAELSPVAGVDGNGKIVAAWLRIKDPAFATPINTASDLPSFYTRLEVVSAVFNPATQSWGPITQLTDDAALDTSLRLSSDGSGNLMLTWLSNAAGEFTSSTSNPSILHYCFWNGKAWNTPATVDSNLVGVGDHEAAIYGTAAFIILPRDPDPEVADDGLLDCYTWSGKGWSAATVFAGGGIEHRLPAVTYDAAGDGHVVWVAGDDLVHATLNAPAPQTVRAGSTSMSFYDTRLMTNAAGNLTLVWQESVDNGPANIFARLYDPASATWSADRRLNQDSTLARDVQGYYGSDGKLHLAYLATAITRTSETVSFPSGATTTIANVPQDGQTDLRLLEHSLITDLAVIDSDLSITPEAPVAETEVNARLMVHNGGDFAVGGFAVKLYAGNPEAGGVVVGTQTVSGLAGGDQMGLDFAFIYPASGGNLVAVIDATNTITEFSEMNNRAIFHLSNSAPVARIVAGSKIGIVPLNVSFDASTSTDADGDALTYAWAFADGTSGATGASVSHTFTQVGAYPVTLVARDAKGAVGTAVVWVYVGESFSDVNPTHPQYTEIIKLNAKGIMPACGSGNFCPEGLVTREQMAAFIIRSLGLFSPPQPAQQRFADVPPTNPYYGFIEEIAAREIAVACGSSNFCPTVFVTQEEMAAIIIRALGEYNPPPPAQQRFADVGPEQANYRFIEQMWVRQISLGSGCGKYDPDAYVTRGQMASLLARAFLDSGGCAYVLCPATQFFPVSGGDGSVSITSFVGCNWAASVSANWITLTSSESGSGSDAVTFLVRENFTASPRQAVITIGGQPVVVIQDSETSGECEYNLSPSFESYPASGGAGSLNVAAEERCAWQAISSDSWIRITANAAGVGNSTVSYTVARNPSTQGRAGTISIGGKRFAVKQKGR